MEEGWRKDVIRELIRRLATVGPDGDRKLDADLWYALTDHRMAPGRYTRSIDQAFVFATALHRARGVRFGIAQEGDTGWVAMASVRDGTPPWDLESVHPHPAPALLQAALRVAVLRPATAQRTRAIFGSSAMASAFPAMTRG